MDDSKNDKVKTGVSQRLGEKSMKKSIWHHVGASSTSLYKNVAGLAETHLFQKRTTIHRVHTVPIETTRSPRIRTAVKVNYRG